MIDYQINADIKFIRATVSDPFYINDLNIHFQQLLADPLFANGTNAIYDFTEVSSVLGSPNDFIPLAAAIEDRENVPERAKVALVFRPGSSAYKVFEGYRLMVTNALVEYRLFTAYIDAERWLNT